MWHLPYSSDIAKLGLRNMIIILMIVKFCHSVLYECFMSHDSLKFWKVLNLRKV